MSELIVVGDDPREEPPAEPVVKKDLNPKQLEAELFRLAIDEDLSGNTVFYRLRSMGMTKLKKQNVEAVGDQLRDAWANSPPAVRARMRLEAAEMTLTGDLIEALGSLELTNPRDVRDCVTHIGTLGGKQVMEQHLRDACEWLEEAGHPAATELTARLNSLFPKESDDE